VHRHRLAALAAVLFCAACWSLDDDRFASDAATTGSSDDGGDSEEEGGGTTSQDDTDDPALATGLPCDIDAFLAARCQGCHVPMGSGPMPLVTYDDLLAESFVDPSLRVVDRMLARMQSETNPMPPAPGTPASADEIALFESWIAAGTPQGECDAGTDETGSEPDDPFDVEPMCSSGTWWDDDDDESPFMHPGASCLNCHAAERLEDPDDDDIPDLLVGGTVYPTAHEPTDCNGDGENVVVVIESVDTGARVELAANSAGNFMLHRHQAPTDLTAPFLVKLVRGDAERVMPIPAPSGNCNDCHTQTGTMGAPGRVVAP
jgi:hypothetical protein